jgi:hypothetical protein
MRLADIEPDLILGFLDHLEHQRRNSIRSRNLRLTALRAFLKFAGRRDVLSLHVIERALSVPMKRFERPMLDFLTREEMLASAKGSAPCTLHSCVLCIGVESANPRNSRTFLFEPSCPLVVNLQRERVLQ